MDNCEHEWITDPMFDDGTVIMLTNIDHPLGEELRQYCKKCPEIRYIPKENKDGE